MTKKKPSPLKQIASLNLTLGDEPNAAYFDEDSMQYALVGRPVDKAFRCQGVLM